MRDDTRNWGEEVTCFPKTGRFLAGRLRHAMTLQEKRLLEELAEEMREVGADARIFQSGALCDFSPILVEGFMLRVIEDETDRSIVGLQVPGDFVDLNGFVRKRLDHHLVALGRVKFAPVPHSALLRVIETEPRLARLLWFSTLLDGSIHRQWISKMGRLRAIGRVAHVLVELWYRLRMVGLGTSHGFTTPLTQIDLSDICGLSEIHTNRSIRDLREGGVVEFRRGRVTILDPARLQEIARFDADYLYGEGDLKMSSALAKRTIARHAAE